MGTSPSEPWGSPSLTSADASTRTSGFDSSWEDGSSLADSSRYGTNALHAKRPLIARVVNKPVRGSRPVTSDKTDDLAGTMVARSVRGIRYFGTSYFVYFLEVCAGMAVLTQAMRIAGLTVMEPVDKITGTDLTNPRDVLRLRAQIQEWRPLYTHLSPNCRIFSQAYHESEDDIRDERHQHDMKLAHVCCSLAEFIVALSLFVGFEHPLRSRMYRLECFVKLHLRAGFYYIDLNLCMYAYFHPVTGERIWKGLRLLTNAPWMYKMGKLCTRDHPHTELSGSYTTASKTYPWEFCKEYANALKSAPMYLKAAMQGWPVAETRGRALGTGRSKERTVFPSGTIASAISGRNSGYENDKVTFTRVRKLYLTGCMPDLPLYYLDGQLERSVRSLGQASSEGSVLLMEQQLPMMAPMSRGGASGSRDTPGTGYPSGDSEDIGMGFPSEGEHVEVPGTGIPAGSDSAEAAVEVTDPSSRAEAETDRYWERQFQAQLSMLKSLRAVVKHIQYNDKKTGEVEWVVHFADSVCDPRDGKDKRSMTFQAYGAHRMKN